MSFGFLGIQFGFALQNANVSRIFETLGASVENIPILWIAARALPWEPLQPDSFTANVAVMEQDGGSLLNHYRRLIHLRAATPALGATAAFIPFDTGVDAVLAFARRDAGGTVVVVANLGGTRVTVPGLMSAAGFLAPGSYAARVLVGAGNAAPLRVGRDGRMLGWVPVPSLGPRDALVLELQPR